jgi:hypothetical protein
VLVRPFGPPECPKSKGGSKLPHSKALRATSLLVDRNELESQLFKNVVVYGIGTVRVAESRRDLRDILGSDYRGLVVSMIHKFDDIPPNINTRESVVVLNHIAE